MATHSSMAYHCELERASVLKSSGGWSYWSYFWVARKRVAGGQAHSATEVELCCRQGKEVEVNLRTTRTQLFVTRVVALKEVAQLERSSLEPLAQKALSIVTL